MAKIIYAYFSENDLRDILQLLSDNGATLRDNNEEPVKTAQAIVNGLVEYHVGCSDNDYIIFTPCAYLGRYMNCGSFYLSNEKNAELAPLFLKIKKHIRKEFLHSKENRCYIGPDIYEEWLTGKHRFPVLLASDRFEMEANKVQALFDSLLAEGFTIKPNDVRLRDLDLVDLAHDSFVIYEDAKKVKRTIANKTWVHYEYGSECVFVYRNKKTKTYSFELDKRLKNNAASSLVVLFERIKEWNAQEH